MGMWRLLDEIKFFWNGRMGDERLKKGSWKAICKMWFPTLWSKNVCVDTEKVYILTVTISGGKNVIILFSFVVFSRFLQCKCSASIIRLVLKQILWKIYDFFISIDPFIIMYDRKILRKATDTDLSRSQEKLEVCIKKVSTWILWLFIMLWFNQDTFSIFHVISHIKCFWCCIKCLKTALKMLS